MLCDNVAMNVRETLIYENGGLADADFAALFRIIYLCLSS
jgi:hypothetical protein